MGYDMRFRKADPDEAAAVEFASKIFRKACDERDELPKSERGVLDFERAKREGLDSHEAHVGRSARYRIVRQCAGLQAGGEGGRA